MKQECKKEKERIAAIRIQRATLAWLYAPPSIHNNFRGGAMYRKFIQQRFGDLLNKETDSWEDHVETIRPMFASHLDLHG